MIGHQRALQRYRTGPIRAAGVYADLARAKIGATEPHAAARNDIAAHPGHDPAPGTKGNAQWAARAITTPRTGRGSERFALSLSDMVSSVDDIDSASITALRRMGAPRRKHRAP